MKSSYSSSLITLICNLARLILCFRQTCLIITLLGWWAFACIIYVLKLNLNILITLKIRSWLSANQPFNSRASTQMILLFLWLMRCCLHWWYICDWIIIFSDQSTVGIYIKDNKVHADHASYILFLITRYHRVFTCTSAFENTRRNLVNKVMCERISTKSFRDKPSRAKYLLQLDYDKLYRHEYNDRSCVI